MEKKSIIIVACLAASLIAGGFALALKNKDVLLAAARGGMASQQWIEIKPRVDDGQTGSGPSVLKAKKASANSTKDKSTAAAAKKATPQVAWCPVPGSNAKVSAVVINEVAWMGTDVSHTDEWIELKNLFRDAVDLGGWQLQNKNLGIKVSFKPGSDIPAGGFYLLERTDDTAVPGVGAGAIYTGNLANTNEALYLFDDSCQLQDAAVASPAWPAGDNASKRTMERTSDLAWRTSIKPGGTPKQENSVY